jgi:hypothetical protein
MRESCFDCVRKHLGQASVLLDEVHLGYPHHRWLCVGHLAEAESEILNVHPEFAAKIRACRLIVMKSHKSSHKACIESLIREACIIAEEDDIQLYEDPNNSKTFAPIFEEILEPA